MIGDCEINQYRLDLQHGSRGHFNPKLESYMVSGVGYLRENDVDQPQEMATHTIAPPAPFNFKNPEEWPKWIRRFERYRISTELSEKDEVLQINTMMYCMGDEADDIVKSFTFAGGDEKKYAKVKEKFDQHFCDKLRDLLCDI